MSNRKAAFTEEDLYGPSGRPHASDIHQDKLQNCYFLAPVGALAEQQTDRIRDAIRFDSETGNFTVRLYRPPNAAERQAGQSGPIEEFVTVSQDDLLRNIRREGGSSVDNNRDRSGALWPAVLEAGFVELYGHDAQGRINLENAYARMRNDANGGSLSDGMYALTGDPGHNIQIPMPDDRPRKNHSPDYVPRPEPPAFQARAPGDMLSLQDAHTRVEQALAAGQPVTLATQGRQVNDGLQESHAYMVMGISRDAATGDTLLRLRNTYGDNTKTREGNHHIGGEWDDSDPEIVKSLNDIVKKGSFGEFNIGPAPRVQSQTQSFAPQAAPPQPVPSQPVEPQAAAPTQRVPALQLGDDMRHPGHPGRASYLAALDRVQLFESQQRIASGPHSERFAAALAVMAERDGFAFRDTFVEADGKGGVRLTHKTFGPDAPDRHVAIDARALSSQSIEASTQQWQQARSALYTPAAQAQAQAAASPDEQQALAQLPEADRAMFERIRCALPGSVSDAQVAQGIVAARQCGIERAEEIGQIGLAGERLLVRSTLETGLKTSLVDLSTPAPALQDSVANLHMREQERQLVLAQAATVQPDAPTQEPAR